VTKSVIIEDGTRQQYSTRPSFLLSDAMGHVVDASSLRIEHAGCLRHEKKNDALA
jgi:hypothetical protein